MKKKLCLDFIGDFMYALTAQLATMKTDESVPYNNYTGRKYVQYPCECRVPKIPLRGRPGVVHTCMTIRVTSD